MKHKNRKQEVRNKMCSARAWFGVACLVSACCSAVDYDSFVSPPMTNRPETWFHLIGGNVARDGLDADLDAIQAAGIGGIHLFHGNGEAWPGVSQQIPCLSTDWDDLIKFAADGCAKRGLSFKMQNCPGWSMSGGPWIKPGMAMRNLTFSRKDIPGGTAAGELPTPVWRMENKLADGELDYKDLFVLAFPTPAGDDGIVHAPKPVEESDANGIMRRRFTFAKPLRVQAIELPSPRAMNHDFSYTPEARVQLFAIDGKTRVCVLDQPIPQGVWQDRVPVTFACDAQTAATWEFVLTHKHPMEITQVKFHSGARLNNWEGLAGWVLRGLLNRPAPKQAAISYVKSDRILDLTGKLKNGTLDWIAPPGHWTILRIGHINTGSRNGPAPKEATGWECNKMDRAAIDLHFDSYIGRLAKGPLAGGKLKGFIVDSWECRRQTWTDSLEKDFRAANGYDFRAKLPAVFGWVIDDPETTETFLRDWRRTLSDLIETNYYARLNELARAHGMTAQYETAFGDVIPGDLMRFWKWCNVPMCEFWHPRSDRSVGQDDFKPIHPCASATHIYGKKRCAAEAFTCMRLTWNEDLKALKRTGNHALARGVTHLVFHTYTHQPRTNALPPGTSFGCAIGTAFIRGQTWWGAMREFTDYWSRCTVMLEAGKPCSDVLWFLGDALGHKPSETSPFADGFHYDYCNQDALLTRVSAKDGKLVLPDGVTYEVLWIPEGTYVEPKSEAKLRALAAGGARIVRGSPEAAVANLKPDVVLSHESPVPPERSEVADAKLNAGRRSKPLEWIHRTEKNSDWYFVCANGGTGYKGNVSFRATHPAVQLWDPVTGMAKTASVVARANGYTTLAFDFAAGESAFVVFGAACRPLPLKAPPLHAKVSSVSKWHLAFPDGWGAPKSVPLDELKSWTALPIGEEGRHFSGTATYTAKIQTSRGGLARLDLGRVETIATVFANGRKVRTIWAPPYRCEIFLREGENDVRVDVTSTWFNRLAYDAGLPEASRKTWTIAAPKKDASLQASGLLGPVTIQ